MPLNFGRGKGAAEVSIDRSRCTDCGLCAAVCMDQVLYRKDGRVLADPARGFGCVGCGHCMAVCPRECVEVRGRDLDPSDLRPLAPPAEQAGHAALHNLLLARRSVRSFQDREVPGGIVRKILDSAAAAPMGVPPSEVGVLVLNGRGKVRAFRNDLLARLKAGRWSFSGPVLALMRPFTAKEDAQVMQSFVRPVVDLYVERDQAGEDVFFYDAPLALHFYGTAWADPADPVIACTCAMLAAEALGLGSCLLGFPPHVLARSRRLREKYGLPRRIRPGLTLVAGYPKVRFLRSIRRRFAEERG